MRVEVVRQLAPPERSRDGSARPRANAIGSGNRFPLDVLEIVDVDGGGTAGFDEPLYRCFLRMCFRDLRGDQLRDQHRSLIGGFGRER